MAGATRRALVIGAGINGLATARGLIRRGWAVEVIEAGAIPNPEAASFDRHRLIRPHYPDHPGYARRYAESLAAWQSLWHDLGAVHLVARGVVALSSKAGDWTDRARQSLEALGLPHQIWPAEDLPARLPHVEPAGASYALAAATGGALLSDRILRDLARWLAGAGAVLTPHCPALSVDPAAGRAETPLGPREADMVVLAAGVGLPGLCPAPVPVLSPRRCAMVYAEIPDDLAPLWQGAPCWLDLGGDNDLWGMPPLPGIPAKLGHGLYTRPGDPLTERQGTAADTACILAAYAGRLKGVERFRPVETVANFYLMAEEERFLLRQTGRVVALSADSGHGFKFGALTGEDVAGAIDTGRVAEVAELISGR